MASRARPMPRRTATVAPLFTVGSLANLAAILAFGVGLLWAIWGAYGGLQSSVAVLSAAKDDTTKKVDGLQTSVNALTTNQAVAVTKTETISTQLERISSKIDGLVLPIGRGK